MEMSLRRQQHRSPGKETRKRYRGLLTWAGSEPGQEASPSGLLSLNPSLFGQGSFLGRRGRAGSWSGDLCGSRRETVLFAHRGSKQRGDIYFIEQMCKQAPQKGGLDSVPPWTPGCTNTFFQLGFEELEPSSHLISTGQLGHCRHHRAPLWLHQRAQLCFPRTADPGQPQRTSLKDFPQGRRLVMNICRSL